MRRVRLPPFRSAVVLALPALLAACVVGPNYGGPPEAGAPAFTASTFRRADRAPVVTATPPARWWEAIGDPVLTGLVEDAFAASPTLKSAAARVRSARAQLSANRANLLPTGGLTANYTRARVPTGSFVSQGTGDNTGTGTGTGTGNATTGNLPDPLKINSYSVAFDASWELDVFGATRRSIESAAAAEASRQAAFEDAQVTLAADMARAYVVLREVQNRVALTLRISALRDRSIALVQQRRTLGTASEADLQQLLDQAAQDRASLPDLRFQVDQQLDQIAILAGREPGAYDALLAGPDDRPIAQPMPPETVAVDEPAQWLKRRPDIREAERTLAARTATIGQNVADYFPTVSLFGLLGTSGNKPGDLFQGRPLSAIVPMLSWSFLNIPRTRAAVRGAEADRDEALADYERTVVEALQDANDSLSRYGRMRSALFERETARSAAERAARLTGLRSRGGTASVVDFLDSERERVATEASAAQARSTYMQAYVSLQKSLGLGWAAWPIALDGSVAPTPAAEAAIQR